MADIELLKKQECIKNKTTLGFAKANYMNIFKNAHPDYTVQFGTIEHINEAIIKVLKTITTCNLEELKAWVWSRSPYVASYCDSITLQNNHKSVMINPRKLRANLVHLPLANDVRAMLYLSTVFEHALYTLFRGAIIRNRKLDIMAVENGIARNSLVTNLFYGISPIYQY